MKNISVKSIASRARGGHGLSKVSLVPDMPYRAVFYPFGHPMPDAYIKNAKLTL
jgi:hypothetical protein